MIQSVDRAVRVLFALQGERRLGIAELAARLDLAPSTVHGIVKTLAVHYLVVQDPGSGRYQLGPAVRSSATLPDTLDLRLGESGQGIRGAPAWRCGPVRSPAMTWWSSITSPPDGSRRCLDRHRHPCPRRGRQAQLAFLPNEAERVLASAHRSMTGETITDADRLRAQFAAIARTALAEEHDEAVLGESSVAAPIFDAHGTTIGAIGVVLPTTDWPIGEGVRDALREAARNISRELGATRWPMQPATDG